MILERFLLKAPLQEQRQEGAGTPRAANETGTRSECGFIFAAS